MKFRNGKAKQRKRVKSGNKYVEIKVSLINAL